MQYWLKVKQMSIRVSWGKNANSDVSILGHYDAPCAG